jgi:phosphoadenosine phosphosulfate reductase
LSILPVLDLEKINHELEDMTPQNIICWIEEHLGRRIALQSSMQKTASSLTDMINRLGFSRDVIFVDTQYHFPETLRTRDLLAEHYPRLHFLTFYPDRTPEQQLLDFGRELYLEDGDYQVCCQLRKEIPWINGVVGKYNAILGGLIRAEEGRRKNIRIISYDDRVRAYKIYPLANWTVEQVDEYNQKHQVPVHPLHDAGFPSIGCSTCTTSVRPDEDTRAGRWRHIIRKIQDRNGTKEGEPIKLYCGINHGENI